MFKCQTFDHLTWQQQTKNIFSFSLSDINITHKSVYLLDVFSILCLFFFVLTQCEPCEKFRGGNVSLVELQTSHWHLKNEEGAPSTLFWNSCRWHSFLCLCSTFICSHKTITLPQNEKAYECNYCLFRNQIYRKCKMFRCVVPAQYNNFNSAAPFQVTKCFTIKIIKVNQI